MVSLCTNPSPAAKAAPGLGAPLPATRIIASFNLKSGVEVAAYEAWARKVDLRTVNGPPSTQKFELFKSTAEVGLSAGGSRALQRA